MYYLNVATYHFLRQSEYSNEDVFPPTTLQRYLSVNSSDSVFDSITNNFDDFRDELMSLNADIALVTCSKDAQNMKELNITKGEYLEVIKRYIPIHFLKHNNFLLISCYTYLGS